VVIVRALRLVPLLLAAAGCGVEFTPRSVVDDTRVLAITAPPGAPLDLGWDDSVTLTAWRIGPPRVDPAAERIESERWSFCPFSVGSTAGYACAVPECEEDDQVPLTQPALQPEYGASNPLTASLRALRERCLAVLAASGTLPPGVPTDPSQLPEKVEVLFRYRVTAAGSREREAVQRIPVYLSGAPQTRNLAPVIDRVEINGIAVRSGTSAGPVAELRPRTDLPVRVVLTEQSAQTYVEGGRELTEQLVVSFYTTAGRFDYDWANGPDASVNLRPQDLPPEATEARVWVVARDLRGGEAVDGPFLVAIVR
jgi:hypothetical protein